MAFLVFQLSCIVREKSHALTNPKEPKLAAVSEQLKIDHWACIRIRARASNQI
jgi:hypothetical protein